MAAQRQALPGAAAGLFEQVGQTRVEGAEQRCGADVGAGQAEHLQCIAIGADDPAVLGEGDDALGDGADAGRVRVQMQAQVALAGIDDQAVLDHPGCGVDQAEGVRMAAAPVARNVENAEQFAGRRDNGRGGAGEEGVALEEMFVAVDFDPGCLGQRSADGVGAALAFVPAGARHQGDALGLAEKVGVAEGVHEHAPVVGEDDHAVAVAHLFEQVFHDRPRMAEQFVIASQRPAQFLAAEIVRDGQTAGRRQAGSQAAPP